MQEPSVPYSTPSHSPFIPDVSITSPDFRFQVPKAGSRSTFPPNDQSALSPLALRQIGFATAETRGAGNELRVETPKSGSRHSFPPLNNPYTLPTTQNSSASQLQPRSKSPQRDEGSGRSPLGILKADSAISSHMRILSQPTKNYTHASPLQPRVMSASLAQAGSRSPQDVSRVAGVGNAARTRMMMK